MLVTELIKTIFERPEYATRAARSRRTTRSRSIAAVTDVPEARCLLSGMAMSALPGASGQTQNNPPGKTNPLTSIPRLNSFAGAAVSIYLDFDGHTETDASWTGNNGGQDIITPVFDIDNDLTTFSDEELRMMEEIWYRTSEDYLPFNINVTTVAPSAINDFESIRIVIGGNGSWMPQAGGVAFLNSFTNSASNTAFVFSQLFVRSHDIATAVSHEGGHTFGLNHHSLWDVNGVKLQEYTSGTPTRAPIMGVGYSTIRDTWDNGPGNVSATQLQDDLAILTSTTNRVIRYRTDDHGNTTVTATPNYASTTTVISKGIIEQNDDVDMFRFETDSGNVSFSVSGLDLNTVYPTLNLTPGTNLDLVLSLYSSNGTLIATSDPGNSLSASINVVVGQGVYYVGVSGTGEYGALGQYTLTSNILPLPSTPTMISPTGTLSNPVPTFEWSIGANALEYELEVDKLDPSRPGYYKRTVTATSHTAVLQFEEGNYQVRVRTKSTLGTYSPWSSALNFTIDVPVPAKPVITRPSGDIITSFPTFIWNSQSDASYYTLWVGRIGTGTREIYRTNHSFNSYQHFNPLADGSYRAWVQAFNTVGERSAWSDPVEFTIDAPTPLIPTITAPTTITTNQNPRIVWTAGEDVWKYDLWVNYLNGSVGQYIREQNIQGRNYYDPSALPQGTYKAWVRAINGNNEISAWSEPYTFTVDILPPSKPVVTGPTAADGSKIVATQQPTFSWTAADRGVVYELWVNNDTTRQAQILLNTSITGTSYTAPTNLPQGNYRAWVRARNSANEVGPWSEAYSFSIDQPVPAVPTITDPKANPAGSVETSTPTFVWTTTLKGDFYELRLHNLTLNRRDVLRVNNIVGESYTLTGAQRLQEHSYTAEVRGGNTAGEYSDWSPAFAFRVDVPNPLTPQILAPSNTLRTRTPKFEWVHSNGSVNYQILVRDLERQEDIVLNVSSFTLNPTRDIASYILPTEKALGNGTYRFWIRAFNSQGTASAWSASRTFVISVSLDPSLLPNRDGFDGARTEEYVMASIRVQPAPTVTVVADGQVSVTSQQPDLVQSSEISDEATTQAVMEEIADPSLAGVLNDSPLVQDTAAEFASTKQTYGFLTGAAMLSLFPFTGDLRKKRIRS